MDIGGWLRSLGLEQYEAKFRENAIDATVLPDLTAEDLRDLGIDLIGHRRKLLAAIAALHTGTKATTADVSLATDRPPDASVERRQVTVMFTDLVGSTALSARMDPEDLRTVIGAYHKCVAETVARFDGFVAKYMGDGVLIYFGYPAAHEDDAERAVRTSLALVDAVASLAAPEPLQVRMGVATGVVVVGDIIGSGEAQERGIVGETPNLAARLQGIAEPNQVVIAKDTRRLLGGLFELQDLGRKDLKGIAGQTQVWAVLRASSVASRFEAMHTTELIALVGREEEFDLLLRRWSQAKTGEGQAVLLSGEAGIGKSRLAAALLERLATEPHTRLRYFCSPQHTDSALYPVFGQMKRAIELADGATLQARLDKLDAVLAQGSTSIEDAALFAEMLSLPNDGRYPALELTPEQRRQGTYEALTSQLAGLARRKPVLMIFEDAQWIDPTSLELLSRAMDKIATLRLLLIVSFRPEFEAPWVGQPNVTALAINRLGRRDIGTMIDRVVGNKLLPANIRQDIIDRTDGIPLFVEEMTKAVLEAESEGEARATAAAVPSPALAVPASLHASLMARLDRLGPAKEIAQIGAAMGREFSHALLTAVTRKPETELASALERLVRSGLLFRQGVPPQTTYLFKHALVQDAAYGTLLREQRRALHARISEALERHFAEIVESQPGLLARHCTEAGQIEKAAGLWGKAGLRSLDRSALVEAMEQMTRSLEQIATLPTTPALRREQIKLQVALINPLMHVKGMAAPETRAAMERARLSIETADALGEPLEDPLLLPSILYSFWVASCVTFNGDIACELAAQLLATTEKLGSTQLLAVGHHVVGISLACTGDVIRGRTHLEDAIAFFDPVAPRPLIFGHDLRATTLCYRSLVMWMLGYPEAGAADSAHALGVAREIEQAGELFEALFFASIHYLLCGRYEAATSLLEELLALADDKSAWFWKLGCGVVQGCVLAAAGKPSDAVNTITAAIAAAPSMGAKLFTPLFLSYLVRALTELDQFDEARRCIDEASTIVETTKERWCEAEVHRVAGELALKSPERDAAKAEAYFERALSVARHQQAKSWELRAAMSMARLWRDQGKRQQARDLLAPVYGWFTEGFDTLDLKQARALLDELAQ
jgi:class 3 adenylate cyclase/predicted ATPase